MVECNLERNSSARPRQANWVQLQEGSPNDLLLKNRRTHQEHILNESAAIIWRLCDGERSIGELIDLFEQHYPAQPEVRQDLLGQLQILIEQKLIVLDGGNDALEYTGGVVRHIQPTAELLWQLELIRQFLLGSTRMTEAPALSSDLEALLGADALEHAKRLDIDNAGGISDEAVFSYKAALRGKSFRKALKKIVRELQFLLPEVTSKIEVAGNSIYQRGAHMGWHSNHSRSDGRIYCSWAERGESNFFRYVDPLTGEIQTHWEAPGWNIKSFTIPVNTARFWHCIGANSLRVSLGFRYELPKAQTKLAENPVT